MSYLLASSPSLLLLLPCPHSSSLFPSFPLPYSPPPSSLFPSLSSTRPLKPRLRIRVCRESNRRRTRSRSSNPHTDSQGQCMPVARRPTSASTSSPTLQLLFLEPPLVPSSLVHIHPSPTPPTFTPAQRAVAAAP
ncbi:hypothetical protein C8R45DRAFT_1209497 [Mycena sanguinolenta]|nr:hypothetical protein C8R45DRAFT_1209497 [Mycena sanguinolenta]